MLFNSVARAILTAIFVTRSARSIKTRPHQSKNASALATSPCRLIEATIKGVAEPTVLIGRIIRANGVAAGRMLGTFNQCYAL